MVTPITIRRARFWKVLKRASRRFLEPQRQGVRSAFRLAYLGLRLCLRSIEPGQEPVLPGGRRTP